ncbi:hypothetical protein OGAPHI_002526 [Ogataea philodendri]|uniref:Spindle pole body component n=1 Tax=Ogataea philodendri TaxID=1378263 RepID=A0A9P8PBK7_9ASCO|nr:uncharacterized protein OGAPHI_002526 [Ogataea philodendri]KAH3668771.1 hypothetical protein OGAPHI_002526 [Ogataea philodendri]
MESEQIVLNYLFRLLRGVFPADFDADFVHRLTNDVFAVLLRTYSSAMSASQCLAYLGEYRSILTEKSPNAYIWDKLQQTVEDLSLLKNTDELARYLIKLDSYENHQQRQKPNRLAHYDSSGIANPLAANTSFANPRNVVSSPGLPSSNAFLPSSTFALPSSRPPSQSLGVGEPLSNHLIPFYYQNAEYGLIPEQEIVKNLVFTLIGSTSEMFPFDDKIKIPTNISLGTSGLLHQIFEPALIYKHLKTLNPKLLANSQIKVAFSSFLQQELFNYTSQVNQILSPANLEHLTLRYVRLQLSDWIVKLRMLYNLSSQIQTLPVNGFLSYLHELKSLGDPVLQELATSVYRVCVWPYFEILKGWILDGNLNREDTIKENFFITQSDTGHKLHTERVPVFVRSAQSIYQIGKSLLYLKNHCDEMKWCVGFASKYQQLYAQNGDFLDMAPNKLDKLLQQQYDEIINHLCYVLYDKFGLVKEIGYLHQLLLMNKGDFINSLIVKGLPVLNESSSSLSSHHLMKILQESIENSSIRHLPDDVLRRLDARILEMGHGNIGWDVFTLDFQIKYPLDSILDGETHNTREYLRMFNFLLRLQKVNYLLNVEWLQSNSIRRGSLNDIEKRSKLVRRHLKLDPNYHPSVLDSRCLWLSKTFKRLNILRNEFIKFVNIITSFFDLEIIEKKYRKLLNALAKTGEHDLKIHRNGRGLRTLETGKIKVDKDYLPEPVTTLRDLDYNAYNLDELVRLHHDYIVSITRSRLFDVHSPSARGKNSGLFYVEQIDSFITTINQFINLNEEFNTLLVDMLSVTELLRDDGHLDLENKDRYDDYLNSIDVKLNKLMEKLTVEIIEAFEDNLVKFTDDLTLDQDQTLRCLGIMLSN